MKSLAQLLLLTATVVFSLAAFADQPGPLPTIKGGVVADQPGPLPTIKGGVVADQPGPLPTIGK
jgi:hypothetical protein